MTLMEILTNIQIELGLTFLLEIKRIRIYILLWGL